MARSVGRLHPPRLQGCERKDTHTHTQTGGKRKILLQYDAMHCQPGARQLSNLDRHQSLSIIDPPRKAFYRRVASVVVMVKGLENAAHKNCFALSYLVLLLRSEDIDHLPFFVVLVLVIATTLFIYLHFFPLLVLLNSSCYYYYRYYYYYYL